MYLSGQLHYHLILILRRDRIVMVYFHSFCSKKGIIKDWKGRKKITSIYVRVGENMLRRDSSQLPLSNPRREPSKRKKKKEKKKEKKKKQKKKNTARVRAEKKTRKRKRKSQGKKTKQKPQECPWSMQYMSVFDCFFSFLPFLRKQRPWMFHTLFHIPAANSVVYLSYIPFSFIWPSPCSLMWFLAISPSPAFHFSQNSQLSRILSLTLIPHAHNHSDGILILLY